MATPKSTPLNNVFNSIQVNKPDTSTFDLSHDLKTSLKMGYLVPINVQEILPGDTGSISAEGLYRLMPMIAPIMQKLNITIHHFFVPNRLLWAKWEQFITGGSYGQSEFPPAFPHINTGATPINVLPSWLPNYLGLPVSANTNGELNTGDINALPFAAYQRIWYDWYRDENQNYGTILAGDLPDPFMLPDGQQLNPMITNLMPLRKRAWEHDYFTSSLPFAQKGTAVDLPIDITGRQTVYLAVDPSDPSKNFMKANTNVAPLSSSNPRPIYYNSPWIGGANGSLVTPSGNEQTWIDPNNMLYTGADEPLDPRGGLNVVGTVNDLRTAMQLQKWLELNARAGSRYIEHISAHFNVRISDYRIARAEYLGGSKSSFAISEVLQTSETATTPQGTMAGHGISYAPGGRTKFRFEEHGFMISILSITPVASYYQGIPKFFRKTADKFQYAFPLLANTGEQPVINEELVYRHGEDDLNNDTFGYLPIYTEYRYNPGRITGQMATTLDFYHLGRKFDPLYTPMLNASFLDCTPGKRIFAVEDEDEDEVVAHIMFYITMNRRLPYFGSPGGM